MIYSTHLQHQVSHFFPDRPNDQRVMLVYVLVKKVEDSKFLEVVKANGFDHLEGNKYWPMATDLVERPDLIGLV